MWILSVSVVVLLAVTASSQNATSSANFSDPGVALEFMLNTSYAVGAVAPDCTALSHAACNATRACYYNTSLMVCSGRTTMNFTRNSTTTFASPWCFQHFPLPFISAVYLLAAFISGFAVGGVIYNALWYDTYSRINDVGERQFNQFYYSTTPINLYCIALVVFALLMAVFSFINLNDESNCTYVYFVYIYVLLAAVPAIGYPAYHIGLWILKKCRSQDSTDLPLDEWVLPKTEVALADPHNCQPRCF